MQSKRTMDARWERTSLEIARDLAAWHADVDYLRLNGSHQLAIEGDRPLTTKPRLDAHCDMHLRLQTEEPT